MVTRILWSLSVVVFSGVGLLSSARAQAAPQPRTTHAPAPKALLAALCAAAGRRDEPACAARDAMSEDETWLVVREACRADSGDGCRRFREQQGGVLIYDMDAGRWRAEWEARSWPLTFDVAGTPTMRLRPRAAASLKVVVANISPLMYSAAPGTPKEDDLEIVSGLKTFLALAGTGLQGLVQTLVLSPRRADDAAPALALPKDAKGIATTAEPAACGFEPPDVSALAASVGKRQALLMRLHQSTRALERELGALDRARSGFLAAVQGVENGAALRRSDLIAPGPGLAPAYDAFESAAVALEAHTADLTSCGPMLAASVTLLGAPAAPVVIDTLAAQVAASECGLPDLARALKENAARLTARCPDLDDALKLQRDAMKPLVERLLNARQVEDRIWQAIDKARDARREVLAGAAVLDREVRSAARHTWDGALIRELVVSRPDPYLPWSKVQSHAIEVKAVSPYVKQIALAHGAEEKHPYKLASATGQILGYGVGLIYTPLEESTWVAAAVPGTSRKVIAEKARETRAGQLAAMLSYRFMEHWVPRGYTGDPPRARSRRLQPTIDLGVALSSDHPAFFGGVGLELFRALRVGAGWSAQRVTTLDAGQAVGVTAVSSSDEIRTHRAFDTKHFYVSATFALDALSLFGK